MNKRIIPLLYIAALLLLILAAGYGYKYLTLRYKAPDTLEFPIDTSKQTPSSTVGLSETPDQKEEPQDKEDPEEGKDAQEEEPEEDEPLEALDFTVQDYDGNEVKLSDYIGTPIVLNFWASWCPPCKDEMPHFNKVSEEYSKDELIFLMVDLVDGGRETVEKGKKHVEDNGYTFTVLFDTEQDAAITYGIRSIPTTLFIDKNGHILGGFDRGINEEMLRYGVAAILDE
ncbi:MAG: TlpA family protein disulfide reductase [Acetivibrionales bacterium]